MALRVAESVQARFSNGVWLVELGDLSAHDSVGEAIAHTLGLHDLAGRLAVEALVDLVADRPTLLVLDNCEHVVEAVASLTSSLLSACPGLKVLATSRELLRVPGEWTMEIGPLGYPETDVVEPRGREVAEYAAVSLFVERAMASDSSFGLTDANRAAVVRIVDQLQGIPLAIELAATRIRVLSAGDLADRLGNPAGMLSVGPRVAPRRHQALRSCIEWSYDLCPTLEQRLWNRLSVFVGGFELDSVEAVCSSEDLPPMLVFDLLMALIDKSVVGRLESDGPARFRMLESLRQFGAERLQSSGELAEVRDRHSRWFGELVAQTQRELLGPDQGTRWHRLDREMPNIRASFDHALATDPASPVCFVPAELLEYWLSRGRLEEGQRLCERTLAEADPTASSARVAVLFVATLLTGFRGDDVTALEYAREAERCAGLLDDPTARALAHAAMGGALLRVEEFEVAVGHLVRATDLLREQREREWLLLVLLPLMNSAGLAGHLELATKAHEEAMRLSESAQEAWFRTHALGSYATGVSLAGDLVRSTQLLREAIRSALQVEDRLQVAWAVEELGLIASIQGDLVRGAVLSGAYAGMAREMGLQNQQSSWHNQARIDAEAALQAGLAESMREKDVTRGAGMGYPEVVAFALNQPVQLSSADQPVITSLFTAREGEVAALVAEGLVNREIALRLYVTPRTVRGHIENMLAKLGGTSRAQIASYYVANSVEAGD
jgi:non-specific serine/threonine protein kinase